MRDRLGRQAVVVGGSIAGLIAARVLSDAFEQVTILERDEIEDRPVLHKSIPQGAHLHGLLRGGLEVLSALYPALPDDLSARDATRVIIGRDVVWYLPDGKAYSPSGSVRMPFDSGLQAFCASRGLIEFLIRRRTTAIPNIRFESGCTVRGLLCRDGMVRGVRCADARSVGADLVVDATGRGHRAREWLEAIGFRAPEETEIGLDTAYSTATFRRPEGLDCEPVVFITGPAPQFTRRGYVIAIENGTWLVSLIGRFGDFPPTDAQGFRAFARELHSDLACRIIESAGQLSPIVHHRFVSSVQRHYERLHALPEGFLAVGDALCTFNPIYAQGMSAAARQAAILREILSEQAERSAGTRGITGSYFARAAEFNSTPWNLRPPSTSRSPQTRGTRPPGAEERARYFAALDRLQSEDEEIRQLMTEVFHLVRPLSVLQQEPLRSRVLGRLAH